MGISNFFFKKSDTQNKSKILLAMPIFNNGTRYQIDKVIENLKNHWGFDVSNIGGDDETVVFKINGEPVAIAYMDIQIPWGDIEGTAQYAYNWPNALIELKDHTAHAIVSILDEQKSPLERFWILSKVLYSVLVTSEAIGVYQGGQSLLIPRDQYLGCMDVLENNDIPVVLWIYIGLRQFETGNCAYTYGLKDFEKQEIEIIDSELSLEELFSFLENIASYVISNDITLKSGETIGYSAEQKIAITSSKGRFVEDESLKFEM